MAKKQTTIRIDEELFRSLTKVADSEDRSLSFVAEKAIKKYLEQTQEQLDFDLRN